MKLLPHILFLMLALCAQARTHSYDVVIVGGTPAGITAAVAAAGAVELLALLIVRRITDGRKIGKPNWKRIGKIAFGIFGALVLGLGMCMIMVWDLLLAGIAVGIAGILLLLCLIPMCAGLK